RRSAIRRRIVSERDTTTTHTRGCCDDHTTAAPAEAPMTTTSSRPHSTTRWRCDCGRIATCPDCACGARAPWVDTATAHDDADDLAAIDDHDLAPTPAPSDDPVRRHLADRLAGYRYRQASWLAGRFQALALAT